MTDGLTFQRRDRRCGTVIFTRAMWPAVTDTRNLRAELPATQAPVGTPMKALFMRILEDVVYAFPVSMGEVLGASRRPVLTAARAALVWTLRQLDPAVSYQDIATMMNRTDHGTAMHLNRVAETRRLNSPEFKSITDKLKEQLYV